MPTCIEVAAELRKLADSLEKGGETEISRPWATSFHHGKSDKGKFLALARFFPHPFAKDYTETDIEIVYETPAFKWDAKIGRNEVCRIVEAAKPAVYECDPLLSEDEEAELVSHD